MWSYRKSPEYLTRYALRLSEDQRVPRNSKPRDDLQDLSWRTRELGPELRRKLFEKVLPQSGPRATPGDGPTLSEVKTKRADPKHAEPKTKRVEPKDGLSPSPRGQPKEK